MAIGTDALFTDAFTRANGALPSPPYTLVTPAGNAWVNDSNQGKIGTSNAGGSDAIALVTDFRVGSANYSCEFDVLTNGSGKSYGVFLRAVGTYGEPDFRGYLFQRFGTNSNFYRISYVEHSINGGSETTLDEVTVAGTGAVTLRAEAETVDGDVELRLYRNDSLVASHTDDSEDKILDVGKVAWWGSYAAGSNGSVDNGVVLGDAR